MLSAYYYLAVVRQMFLGDAEDGVTIRTTPSIGMALGAASLGVLVFGIVPMNKICVTPKASLGFHQAYYDKAFTFGIKVTSTEGTSDLMSYYPDTVKDWIRRNGGLTTEMKKIKNGNELWKIVDPCPDEW